ncbi:protein FAM160B1-like isoform X2 [Trichogramma pretiosum]|uniref:protein FAM160B1-like isoform X2 n=1 Tax=Trichogramma pretiosum TaxID=7493 RepID=UPI0006C95257|nr:protein FAM160B1-like isoform X2 [Trichogramma pretiosum]
MISGLQIALKNAIDVIAPPATPLQNFTYYWKQLMNFYVNHLNDSRVLVECTGIPRHLDRLLELLLEEEKHVEEPGPCLEYLLQHRLLDLLATLACAETPPGMRLVCLSFIKKLLTRSKHPLLHHASVYGPVQRLIAICNGNLASPIENEEIHFLNSICFLVCKYPHVTNIVNDSSNVRPENSYQKSEAEKSDVEQVTYIPFKKSNTNNPLFKPLNTQVVTLVNPELFKSSKPQLNDEMNKSSQISEESQENKPSNHVLNNLTRSNSSSQSSGSSRDVAAVDSSAYDPVLEALSDMRIVEECISSNDDNKSRSSKHDITLSDSGIPENSKCLLLDALKSYVNSADHTVRIRACEGIMVLASLDDPFFADVVAKSDLSTVLTHRLEMLFNQIPAHVEPLEIDEIEVTWGLDSPPLMDEKKFPGCRKVAAFFMWLDFCGQLSREAHPDVADVLAQTIRIDFLEKVLTPKLSAHHAILITALVTKCLKEVPTSPLSTEMGRWLVGHQREPDIPEVWCSPVIHKLIENCHTDSEELTIETLKLFEEMIEKKDEHILHCLVLTYLNNRGYYDNSAADSAIVSWSDEEDEREREKKSSMDMTLGTGHSRTLAPSNIHRILNCFLSLVPRPLQTDLDSNYSRYMVDWEKQYSIVVKDCSLLAWPLEAVSMDDSASVSSRHDTADSGSSSSRFYPGPFLTMLLDKVSNIVKQKYEINLQLTVLVSKLALLPHPYLHEFLLNPLIPLVPGKKSLFICLQRVVKQLMNEVPKIPNFKQALKETRLKFFEECCPAAHSSNHEGSDRSKEDIILLESVIVTEEFCKELAAIAYVKYHHST